MTGKPITQIVSAVLASTAILTARADFASRIAAAGDIKTAAKIISEATPDAAKTSESFDAFLAETGKGVAAILSRQEISYPDIIQIGMMANKLDAWSRPLSGGQQAYARFIKTIANAAKTAKPQIFGGMLECQMRLVLFTLAIEDRDVAAAVEARKETLALTKYEGEAGASASFVQIYDVAFALIAKNPSAALAHYKEIHKKLSDMGIADTEEILWPTLAVLKEKGVDFGELKDVYNDLDRRFNKGVKIKKVVPGSPADNAGWRKGDRIVAVDGSTVLWNSDDFGRTHLEAMLVHRRNTPNRKPTSFTLKRNRETVQTTISEDSLGIEY